MKLDGRPQTADGRAQPFASRLFSAVCRLPSAVYFFEIFTVANFLAILLFARHTRPVVLVAAVSILNFVIALAGYAAAGIAIRALIGVLCKDRHYLRVIRRRGWIVDTIRMIVFGAFSGYVYAAIKLVVPVEHPRLFDPELWNLDRILGFGFSPNIFLLTLFSNRPMLVAIDWSYAMVFFLSMSIAFAYFLSYPGRRVRVAFTNGNAALWLIGGWTYMLLPSLGPAYRFPDVWLAYSGALERTQHFQALLMRNYQNFLRFMGGQRTGPVQVLLGIGAFPSLHVAFQTYVFLWLRRLWTSGEVLFGLFAALIFLGSIVTGWHYLIDAIAGVALAAACYAASSKAAEFRQFRRLLPRFTRYASHAD